MADVTVEELAATVKTPVERLLKQMADAGLPHTNGQESVSEQQKHDLLAHLRSSHGAGATLKPRGTISLKRRSVGTVKAVSQGRTGHKVKVEVMRRRTYVKPDEAAAEPAAPAVREPTAAELEAQRIRDQEQQRKEAEEETRRAAERKAEEAERLRKEEEQRAQEEQAAKALKEAESPSRPTSRVGVEALSPEVAAAEAQAKVQATEKAGKRVKGKDRDRANRDGFGQGRPGRRELSLKSERRGRRKIRRAHAPIKVEQQGGEFKPTEFIAREVEVPEMITVGELAQRMTVKAGEVIKTLMDLGLMATINQAIDQDTATTVVEVMGHKVKLIHEDAMEQALEQSLRIEGEGEHRPPVVTVMGHVDHGKTSLLDKIRHTRVVSGEAGGITQHIGAYSVDTDHGRICFIDTPGHAAFTAMRARGARVTDIVILVVAADDGVMPQTEEAIQHAKAADVPIVVAINKMDLEGADPERVTKELAAKDVAPEAWGGDIQFVNVSAVTGEGLDSLLEAILLQAEILELKAVPDASARGVVVESRLDRGRGPVSTILVQNGTLKRGDIIIAGEHHGRVRAMLDDQGEQAVSAGPSQPVEVLGLNGTPAAGDAFSVVTDERSARELAEFRRDKTQEQRQAMQQAAKLDNMFASLGEGEKRVLKLVVKADVRGSLEAIVQALAELGNDEVAVNVLGSGVGGITESDINLALTYGAAVFGFNVRADGAAKDVIESEGVDLRYYSVIYELIDDVRQVLSGMLAPEVREEILGVAEVRDVFNSPRLGQIAGCMVTEGTVHRNKPIRVLRDNVVIYEGELESLRRFKDDVTEVRHGTECGIGVRNYNDVRLGDLIEVFESQEIARAL
ncbi:MAG: translation initiation factor IF-2 [Gammaproteobacteria bacterium]|nr:translation initiation factor IF-2 [Gammaproteobacteria bacterium]MDE0270418.1 translation initiation factor IF-2 [Gammaproteobacteria bacterium]